MLDTANLRLRGRLPNRRRDCLWISLALALALHGGAMVTVAGVNAMLWALNFFPPKTTMSTTPARLEELSLVDIPDDPDQRPFLILNEADEALNDPATVDANANVSRAARQTQPAPANLPIGAAHRALDEERLLTLQSPGAPGWSEPAPPETAASNAPDTPPVAAPAAPTAPAAPVAPIAPRPPEVPPPSRVPPPSPDHDVEEPRPEDAVAPVPDPLELPSASPAPTPAPETAHAVEPPSPEPPPPTALTERFVPVAPAATPAPPVRPAASPAPPTPPETAQPPRPRPPIRRIGEGPARPGERGGAMAGNTRSRALLFDGDNVMRTLRHRYGEYMAAVGRQLEQSVRREEVLNPRMYRRGAVRIRFGIGGDGALTFREILDRDEGMGLEQIMAEQVLAGAAPFPEQTEAMRNDPLFQRLTFILYIE